MFRSQFFSALGAWQRGWNEDPQRRASIAQNLTAECQNIPSEFRTVVFPCYRKRYLFKGDFYPLFLGNGLIEGVSSWTLDLTFAKKFKGQSRVDAATAVILKRMPSPGEVLVNVASLWASDEFVEQFNKYKTAGGANADAIENFRATQAEVILDAPLIAREVIGFTGVSSGFDELCDRVGVVESARQGILKTLMSIGLYPDEPGWVWDDAAQRVISRSIAAFRALAK